MSSAPVATVWPDGQAYLPPLIATLFLLIIPLLAILLAKRWPRSSGGFRRMPFIKQLVCLILLDTLIFTEWAAIILLGVGAGPDYGATACSVSILACVVAYTLQKVLIYLFLMERVYLVHSHNVGASGDIQSRMRNRWYLASVFLLTVWIGAGVSLIFGRISYIRAHDGVCIIGLKLYSTAIGVAVDFCINMYLTCAFVWPIWRSKFQKARKLARNSVLAALAAMATTVTNILVLAVHGNGRQQSFVCLSACALDAGANALIIYFVTRISSKDDSNAAADMESPPREPTQTATDLRGRVHAISFPSMRSCCRPGVPAPSTTRSEPKRGHPKLNTCDGVMVVSETTSIAEECDMLFVPTRQGWRVDRRPTWTASTSSYLQTPPLAHLAHVEDEDSDEKKGAGDERPQTALLFPSQPSSTATSDKKASPVKSGT